MTQEKIAQKKQELEKKFEQAQKQLTQTKQTEQQILALIEQLKGQYALLQEFEQKDEKKDTNNRGGTNRKKSK